MRTTKNIGTALLASSAILAMSASGSTLAAENQLTFKLETTTNDHALTLPKIAYTRRFEDSSSLMLEKSWYWQDEYHDSGWPKHDEAFVNYSLPTFTFGNGEAWSLTPQLGAKFRSNNTRALAALKLGYHGEGWSLAGRYRYEQETDNSSTDEKSSVGRVDIYAHYSINDQWSLLYNPHYHFKQESDSPDFGTGDRNYIENEFIAFYNLSDLHTLFGGYIQRDRNSDDVGVDPGQRNSSWLLGYTMKF